MWGGGIHQHSFVVVITEVHLDRNGLDDVITGQKHSEVWQVGSFDEIGSFDKVGLQRLAHGCVCERETGSACDCDSCVCDCVTV